MLSCLAVLRAVCCCCQTGWSVWFNYIPNLTYNSSIVGFVLIFLLFPFFSFPLPSLYLSLPSCILLGRSSFLSPSLPWKQNERGQGVPEHRRFLPGHTSQAVTRISTLARVDDCLHRIWCKYFDLIDQSLDHIY